MKHDTFATRLALACALALSAASIAAMAGEAGDTTEIEVTANGVTEKLSIADLKVGETRQVYSEAGTLVTATRTQDSLQLDIGGEKTSVPMIEIGELGDGDIEALIARHHGDDPDGKHVVRIHRVDGEHAKADGAHRKIVLIDGKDGELRELDGDAPHLIVADGAEGKRVIVRRKAVEADTDGK